MDALQRAVPIPQHEVGMCGAFRRQVLRQRLPLAARREHVEDRVQNLADVHLAPTPTAFGRRYRRFDQRPLAVAQIARVAQAVAVGRTAMFRLPHIGTPQPRFGCQRRNHNRFLRFNNFVDRLLGGSGAWGGYPLVGTPAQIVEELIALTKTGLDGVVLSWVNYHDEMRQWIAEVLPLIEPGGL